MDSNIVSALIGVGMGWALSQLTDILKERRIRNKKIESIYVEMSDIHDWLARMLAQAKYSLQLIVLKQNINSIPSNIYSFLFEEHFHEVCIDIPRNSRTGLTDCYDSINGINELINQLKTIIDTEENNKAEKLCGKFEAIYTMAFTTKWKINFLIANRGGDMRKLQGMVLEMEQRLTEDLKAMVYEAHEKGIDKIRSEFYAE